MSKSNAQPHETAGREIGLRDLARFYRIFGRHYRSHWYRLLAAGISLLLGIGLALLAPWPLAWMIDHVIRGEPLPPWMAPVAPWLEHDAVRALGVFAASFVAIKTLHAVITFFDKYLIAAVGEYMATDIRDRAFAHLQRLSLTFHSSRDTGDLIYRLTRDIGDIRELLVVQPEALCRSVVTILAFAGVMLWLNWQLALVAFAALPLLWAMTHYTQTRLRGAEGERKRKESRLALVVNENVRALSLVQAYGQEETERTLFDAENEGSLKADVRVVRLERRFKRAMDLLIAATTAGVLYLGGQAVLGGALTLGAFVVFYAYIDELYGPVDKLTNTVLGFARNQVAGERILELIENDMVVADRKGAIPAPPLSGRIEFRNVGFCYANGSEVLRDASFVIEPGQTVALVGRSGAGKSTLISLLLRFFEPTTGEILIDGEQIGAYQIESLREQMTILPQEAVLLHRSLRENIAFGRPEASEQEVVAAAQQAEAHAFIEALPEGYDHSVAEAGGDLSGGQRQRIHIARAIVRDTPIVILDEPLRGLDAESEASVQAALDRLVADRTALVIAHRLATIERADRILVLADGGIAEQGTHAELMGSSSLYRELYELQIARPTAA
jgi:ATP-binding cassette subfamily B protein